MSDKKQLSKADISKILDVYKKKQAAGEVSAIGRRVSADTAVHFHPQVASSPGFSSNSPSASGPGGGTAVNSIGNKELSSFASLPAYKQLKLQLKAADHTGIKKPYFMLHEGAARDVTVVDGRELLNFSTYDYLGLNADPRVNAAAAEAAARYGTSAGASRLVAGERPVHRALEQALAALYHTPDAVVYVGGYATNITTIASLFGPQDVIFADRLCHNSIMTGAQDSGAARIVYPHNDPQALRRLLEQNRSRHQRALIVTEGVFSMDGNIAKLQELIALKREFNAFLMVDEAHALGCIGAHGGGSREYFNLQSGDVDIWMGSLSKTLCSCGGFIAGCAELIELLKYKSPGFVYSVGLSPVLAASSLKALQLMQEESWRTEKLQHNGRLALEFARSLGLNTGLADGTAVLPIIIGSSLTAAFLSNLLVENGVCVLPIIYPVVPEGSARLRFFLSASHSEKQIKKALQLTADLLPEARRREAFFKERARELKNETLAQLQRQAAATSAAGDL